MYVLPSKWLFLVPKNKISRAEQYEAALDICLDSTFLSKNLPDTWICKYHFRTIFQRNDDVLTQCYSVQEFSGETNCAEVQSTKLQATL